MSLSCIVFVHYVNNGFYTSDHVSSVSSVQQWAVSFGKDLAALSARYSGAKLLQKVRHCTQTHVYLDTSICIHSS